MRNYCKFLCFSINGRFITIIWSWFKKKEICETKKELLFSSTIGIGLIFMLDVMVLLCMF